MFDDKAMYDDARMTKLKELRRLMVDLELEDMNGSVDADKLEQALEEATDGAMAKDGLSMDEGEGMEESDEELAMEEPEEDPLAVARRKFFKPERKVERSPGTAVMLAVQSKKPVMGKNKGGKV